MKIRISRAWMANFSANVVGVVIGIALTFGVSHLVQRHHEKKQVREMMVLVRQELQENKEWLQNRVADYKKDFGIYQVLSYQACWEKISKDSLLACIQDFNNGGSISSTRLNAWNMFQNSGYAQRLGDFDLVSKLSECYFYMRTAGEWWNEYLDAKNKASGIYDVLWGNEPYAYLEALAKNEESKNFLQSYVLFNRNNQAGNFETIITYIDYILDLIDRKGNYNYEPKIKDDDFANFLKKRENERK